MFSFHWGAVEAMAQKHHKAWKPFANLLFENRFQAAFSPYFSLVS